MALSPAKARSDRREKRGFEQKVAKGTKGAVWMALS
jgi:hypothetical protein